MVGDGGGGAQHRSGLQMVLNDSLKSVLHFPKFGTGKHLFVNCSHLHHNSRHC